MRTNHCHQNALGCIVENNQASNASIVVHSAGDVFDDNGLGCMIRGGLVSTGSANWSTTKFDAYQSVFANNTRTNFNPKVTGGDNLVLDGLFIAIWARATLGGNWGARVTLKENHEFIQRGPYRTVRHPIYSGLLLMILASAEYC